MAAHLATATHLDNSSSRFAHKVSNTAITNFIRTVGRPGLSDKRGRLQDEAEMSNNQQIKQSAECSYCVCVGGAAVGRWVLPQSLLLSFLLLSTNPPWPVSPLYLPPSWLPVIKSRLSF